MAIAITEHTIDSLNSTFVIEIYFIHCKKERVILTNFGHLSCTPLRSKSLSKVICLHIKFTHLERCISLINLFTILSVSS